ncbi:MAG: nucleoside hydrolase [Planctomycetota bacterium]
MKSMVFLAMAAAWLSVSAVASPPRLIIDTDFGPDADDAAALAVAHRLADLGEVELIGVVGSTNGPNIAGAIDAVNAYYGRGKLPVGLVANPPVPPSGGDTYAPALANPFRFGSNLTNAGSEDSTALYRRLLNDAPDGSVRIVVIGGQTGLSRLLDSPANAGGDGIGLTGAQLIAAKVDELVVMGGHFENAGFREFNIQLDPAAADNVATSWPTRIVYSGFEVGNEVRTGEDLSDPENNPVAKAYEYYPGTAGGQGVIGDRQSWDQTAVLYAGRGEGDWTLSEAQQVSFNASAQTIVAPDATGNRFFLNQPDSAVAAVRSEINALMTAGPANPGTLPADPLANWDFVTPNAGDALPDRLPRTFDGQLLGFNVAPLAGDTGDSGWTAADGLRFDGEDDSIATDLPLSALFGGSFTVEARFAYAGSAGDGFKAVLGSSADDISGNNSGEIFFLGKNAGSDDLHLNLGGEARVTVAGSDTFDGGTYHIAVVFDDENDEVRIFQDGLLLETIADINASFPDWSSNLLISGTGHSDNEFFEGTIDYASVTLAALSPEDFLAIPEPGAFVLLFFSAALCTIRVRNESLAR